MISNKAIQKSLDNGFSTQEHFSAVDDIQALYQKSKWIETTDDKNGEKYLKIHRYEADINEQKQAKITLKENAENGSRIYTLELEALAPKIPQRSEAKGEQIAMSRKPEPAHPDTPTAIPSANSTTPIPKSQITSNDLEALDGLKTFFQKQQKESIDDIAQLKTTLKKQQEALRKNIQKFIKKGDPEKLQLEADLRDTQAQLVKAYSEKTYFKAQEKELKNIESTLKDYQTSIDSFSQNPSAKNLAPLHKIKKKLYATLEATENYLALHKPDNLNRTLNEALETTLEAISQSRKAIALKKTNPSTPNPVQEFREFITSTRNDIDYVLGNFDKDTALKVLDEKLASTTNKNQKRFLSRLKNEIAQAATPDNIDIIADKNLKQGIKMENQMDNKKLKQAFGTNYADFSDNGIEAFNHLEQVKNGFVSGAFHRQDIGDIDLVWGKVWKNDKGNIEGYGLSKIIQKHPEITAQKLNDIITKGKIKTRKNEATQIFYDGHKVLLKQNWNGESLKNRWIVTAYAKE